MSTISVFSHIRSAEEVAVELHDGDAGRYAVLEASDLAVFINDREKLLEIASRLGQAAQQWEGEE